MAVLNKLVGCRPWIVNCASISSQQNKACVHSCLRVSAALLVNRLGRTWAGSGWVWVVWGRGQSVGVSGLLGVG
jgi:hypothetical protein